MTSAAEHWDARYETGTVPPTIVPPEIVTAHLGNIGSGSNALDVASGWGDGGLYLASQGAAVTFVDVSSVALTTVVDRAATIGADVTTLATDLTVAAVPGGPWDAITVVHYLDRELLPRLGATLARAGRLAVAVATVTNLERHDRPSARFLLDRDELPALLPNLEVLHFSEDWRANGVHEAWLVASPPSSAKLGQ